MAKQKDARALDAAARQVYDLLSAHIEQLEDAAAEIRHFRGMLTSGAQTPEDCRARLDGELTKLAKKLAAY